MKVQKLRLEYIKASQLNEHPGNWRTHPENQEALLTDLISEVGFSTAVLFNERTGRIVDGHLRKKIAYMDGDPEIPVLIGDWSEEEEMKLLISIDPVAALAEADAEKADALIRSVQTASESINEMLNELGREVGLDWVDKESESNGAGAPDYQVVVLCSSEDEADETKEKLLKMGMRVQ